MLSPSQCVSKSVEARAQSINYNTISVGKLHFGSVALCVYVDTVILGHGNPGSGGSARWTISSSGGLPESHPS